MGILKKSIFLKIKNNSNEKVNSNDMEFKSEIPSPALLKQIFQHSIFTGVIGHHHHSTLSLFTHNV